MRVVEHRHRDRPCLFARIEDECAACRNVVGPGPRRAVAGGVVHPCCRLPRAAQGDLEKKYPALVHRIIGYREPGRFSGQAADAHILQVGEGAVVLSQVGALAL